MTYFGHVQNGTIILDDSALLPDGAKVTVVVSDDALVSQENAPTLYEQFESLIGIAKGLPQDLALNHDHYLHGLPKK